MCTSVVSNRKKTIVGWNLDILDMKYEVVAENDKVYIAINDNIEGWMPLFGANAKGNFVAMPTCWPFDERSNPVSSDCHNIIKLNIDVLLEKNSLQEIRKIAETEPIYSVHGITFQSQLSDKEGNVLQIVPGQGYKYFERPEHVVLTNFSPFKGSAENHPWMGRDRYDKAVDMLNKSTDDFDVTDCLELLKATSQTMCPTVVSMIFDVTENTVYWWERQDWENKNMKILEKS